MGWGGTGEGRGGRVEVGYELKGAEVTGGRGRGRGERDGEVLRGRSLRER